MHSQILKNVRHNFVFNVLDGAFFGFGMGFASTVTIIPLFVATLTDSAVIIGMIASLHTIGWFLPQLLTADYVARLRRYKRMVITLTIHERWPFLALAVVAMLVPTLGDNASLILVFLLFAWHSLGGGITATAWQSMIGKIIPADRRGTFYGTQSAAANLLASISVAIAGWMLVQLPSPIDFALCFLLTSVFMAVSWALLAQTREPESEFAAGGSKTNVAEFRSRLGMILKNDVNFRWFLAARILSQFTAMAVSFYTIFATRQYGIDEQTVGMMASLLMLSQTAAGPVLGWIGDRWGHRRVFALGGILAASSAFLAFSSTGLHMLYVAFALAGAMNATLWATAMSITAEFGTPESRPYYIGLSNTLIGPAALVAPFFGGWLADTMGFGATFTVAIIAGLGTAALTQFVVRDPNQASVQLQAAPAVGD